MDYLKGELLASVPALFVIARFLHAAVDPVAEKDLQAALGFSGGVNDDSGSDDRNLSGVLEASLKVGADLELFAATGQKGARQWGLHERMSTECERLSAATSEPFRAFVLMCLGERAQAAAQDGKVPSDVARGMTWLMLQDPRRSLPTKWNGEAEVLFKQAQIDVAVSNGEQYRSFTRWVQALGLGTLTRAATDAKARLTIDPTWAVKQALPDMPARAPAAEWLSTLRRRVAVLGDEALMRTVPAGTGTRADEVPGAIALALLKLEKANRLELVRADDARGVTINLSSIPRPIAEIVVAATG